MQRVEICIRGLVDEQRSAWFEGFQVIPIEPDRTIIAGTIVDHASLFGLLAKIRDLGLSLVSVHVSESTVTSAQDSTELTEV
jgi:hypothetical protein